MLALQLLALHVDFDYINVENPPKMALLPNFFKAGSIVQVEITIIIYESVGCKEFFLKKLLS